MRVLCALVLGAVGLLAAAPPAYADEPAAEVVDSTGPELVTLTASPDQVDVSSAPAAVAVSMHLSDESGVTSATARISAAGGAAPLHLASGTAVSGTWSGTVSAPAGLAHGSVSVLVDAVDALGSASSLAGEGAVTVLDATPAAPTGISATVDLDTPGTLRVDWSPPVANGGSPVTAYEVSATPSDAAPGASAPGPTLLDAAARTTRVTGLSADTRYVVRVAARNVVGPGAAAVADATTALDAVTVPDAPTGLLVSALPGSLLVSWAAPASDGGRSITAYELRARPRTLGVLVPPVTTAAATSTSVVVGSLVNGVTYDVALTAVNEVGSSLAAGDVGMPLGPPDAPGIGPVTPGDASATVHWTAPKSDGGTPVTAYEISASPSGLVHTVGGDARSAVVSPLKNGEATTFQVVAISLLGPGPASKASAPETPRKPGRLLVTAQPVGRVVHGTNTVVGAALVDAAGTGIAGQVIDLHARVITTNMWRRVARGTTGSDGRVTLHAALPASSYVRLHHPPGAVAAPNVAARTVYVASKLTASPSSTRIRAGTVLAVRGYVGPAHPSGSRVTLQRYGSGAWHAVAHGRMVSTTSYAVSWTPTTPGTYILRVVKPADPDHAIGASPQWRQAVVAESAADIANAILGNSRITLATVHAAGVRDYAHPRQNIVDVAAGRYARRSSYGTAPGGSTPLDLRLLRAIRQIGANGSVTVSEIAGGTHARNSTHYSGRGLDISWVNGRHVGPGSGYQIALDACRAHGASAIYHPSYDPYGGHHNHVHCQWG